MHDYYGFQDLELGMRINVEGDYDGNGAIRARGISIKLDGEMDEIEAVLERSDTASRTLGLLGLELRVSDGLDIRDLDKRPIDLDALAPGTRIKTKGHLREGRFFDPVKIKIKSKTPDAQDEIEGKITSLDPQTRTLTVMGYRIDCDENVEIEA